MRKLYEPTKQHVEKRYEFESKVIINWYSFHMKISINLIVEILRSGEITFLSSRILEILTFFVLSTREHSLQTVIISLYGKNILYTFRLKAIIIIEPSIYSDPIQPFSEASLDNWRIIGFNSKRDKTT